MKIKKLHMRPSQVRKKGVIEFSFTWLFAIIVGAFILFLAIFFAVKLIDQGKTQTDIELGLEIGILTNPLEMGFESASSNNSFSVPSETKLFSVCGLDGYFGTQQLKVSQKSFGKWSETELASSFKNKYFFASNNASGKKFYLFSKPFEFPFKIADLIYISSEKEIYCFEKADDNIKEEVNSLRQTNLLASNCSGKNFIDVCENCEIKINSVQSYVEKNGERMYFVNDALMFAAIFSEKELYDCQVSRLMKRLQLLASIYEDKASITSSKECKAESVSGGEGANLINLINSAKLTEKNPIKIVLMKGEVEEIKEKNSLANCKLW